MTALTKYQRLECVGLWRLTANAQLREVVVGLRDTTLVLADPRSEMALSHWSLPSVERVNPGEMPALFTPGRLEDGSPSETVEVDDPEMIAALDTVRSTLTRRRPKPGRLRAVSFLLGLIFVVVFGVFWLPEAMIRHTASVLPMATRVQIGKRAVAEAARLTGSACAGDMGRQGAAALAQRLSGQGLGEIVVVRDGVSGAVALPGGIVVVSNALILGAEDAEPLAGFIVAALLRAKIDDPVIALLRHAGLMATIGLLTSGHLPDKALAGYAEVLLDTPPTPLADAPLLEKFRQISLSSSAYARSLDPSGKSTAGLIAGDPFQGSSPAPILPDNDWIRLQGICAN